MSGPTAAFSSVSAAPARRARMWAGRHRREADSPWAGLGAARGRRGRPCRPRAGRFAARGRRLRFSVAPPAETAGDGTRGVRRGRRITRRMVAGSTRRPGGVVDQHAIRRRGLARQRLQDRRRTDSCESASAGQGPPAAPRAPTADVIDGLGRRGSMNDPHGRRSRMAQIRQRRAAQDRYARQQPVLLGKGPAEAEAASGGDDQGDGQGHGACWDVEAAGTAAAGRRDPRPGDRSRSLGRRQARRFFCAAAEGTNSFLNFLGKRLLCPNIRH